jgi:iron complex transport system substrate-binding protein
VLDFLPRTVAELLAGMENIIEIAGAGRAGRDLVASLRERTKRVEERTVLSRRPKVFFLMGEDPLTTPGPGSCQGEALTLAGAGLMPAGKGVPVLFPSWDEVASYDPEIIIACGVTPGGLPRKRCPGCRLVNPPCARDVSDLPGRPYLAKVAAVKRGRVYPVPCHWLCRPGPRLINGIEKLFEVFHS